MNNGPVEISVVVNYIMRKKQEARHLKKKAKNKKTHAQCNREYRIRQRESNENILHPDSIAMENPESNLTPLFIRRTSDQASENQTLEQNIELPITQNFRRGSSY